MIDNNTQAASPNKTKSNSTNTTNTKTSENVDPLNDSLNDELIKKISFPCKIRFNIVNFQKSDSQYCYGLKPTVRYHLLFNLLFNLSLFMYVIRCYQLKIIKKVGDIVAKIYVTTVSNELSIY